MKVARCSNCTLLELKQELGSDTVTTINSSNCTLLELKQVNILYPSG